jgi:ABC-type multidrug transport system fused ATPase/permease subunit
MISFIKNIFKLLKQYNIKSFYYVFALLLFISIVELLGVSIIMPFISIASDFSNIQNNEYLQVLYNYSNFKDEITFILLIGGILVCFYVFRFLMNMFFAYKIASFSYKFYEYLVTKLYITYISIHYHKFIKQNSSNFTKSIITEAQSFTFMIIAVLQMVSELFVVVFIYGFLLFINFSATLYISLGMGLAVVVIMKTISKKIKSVGTTREIGQKRVYESLHSTVGNYKILKLHKSKEFIINDFKDSVNVLATSNITYQSLSAVPKLLLELIGFIVIIVVISLYIYTEKSNIQGILPLVSLYVLAMYRLLPSVSRIITGYNSLMYAHKSYDIIQEHLSYELENLGEETVSFKNSLELQNASFYYDKKHSILDNVNLTIKKGEKIAFIGPSGSGKSTISDILMGLHNLKDGMLKVDGIEINKTNLKDFRSKIGYIPQQVYLFDGSIKDNVVFGEDYDESKLIDVLKQSQIYDFLLDKDGIDTEVGEGGNLLSGGQKQRVAIARALYSNPDILVLDEATSALDTKTEKLIMENIYSVAKDKTLIIIAHRLSTIEKCDKVYEIKDGKLMENIKDEFY